MLAVGNLSICAQSSIDSSVINEESMMENLLKMFPQQRTSSEQAVKKMPKLISNYVWDFNEKDFIEESHTNLGYDKFGNQTSIENIFTDGNREYSTLEYDKNGNPIAVIVYTFNKNGFNPVNPYKPLHKFLYEYDDVVTNYPIIIKRQSRYKDDWTNDLMFPDRYEITLTRDEQNRVIENSIIGDTRKGNPYRFRITFKYNEDGTVNIKRYVPYNDNEICSDSVMNAEFYKNSGQFVHNCEGMGASTIIMNNEEYGILPKHFVVTTKNSKVEYIYFYHDDGEHYMSSIINHKEGQDIPMVVTLSYVHEGDIIVENNIMGYDINKDGAINIGDDYISNIQRKEIYKDEFGNQYRSICYKSIIKHSAGNNVPTTADDIEYKISLDEYDEFKYDEYGNILEIVSKQRNSTDDDYLYTTKVVFSDFESFVPTDINEINNDRCDIRFNGSMLYFGAEADYEIFDMEGRMVTRGNAKYVNVNALANGMYIVKAGNKAVKFVK